MVLLEKAESQQNLVLLRKENENAKQQAQVGRLAIHLVIFIIRAIL